MKPERFPVVESRIPHPLQKPQLPEIKEEAFVHMMPQRVEEALVRYHSYVEEQLKKVLEQFNHYTEEVREKQKSLHVTETVRVGRECEGSWPLLRWIREFRQI